MQLHTAAAASPHVQNEPAVSRCGDCSSVLATQRPLFLFIQLILQPNTQRRTCVLYPEPALPMGCKLTFETRQSTTLLSHFLTTTYCRWQLCSHRSVTGFGLHLPPCFLFFSFPSFFLFFPSPPAKIALVLQRKVNPPLVFMAGVCCWRM